MLYGLHDYNIVDRLITAYTVAVRALELIYLGIFPVPFRRHVGAPPGGHAIQVRTYGLRYLVVERIIKSAATALTLFNGTRSGVVDAHGDRYTSRMRDLNPDNIDQLLAIKVR